LSFDSDQRARPSPELRALLDRYPRATWPSREIPATEFWLDVHTGFRRDAVALTALGQDFLDRRLRSPELAVVAGARLRGLVALVYGHHEVEDHHYFPTLRASHPDLGRGFDLLTRDHVTLADDTRAALAALAELTSSAQAPSGSTQDAAQRAAERFVSCSERLHRRLLRHLDDEEDLVIPALIERG
jgi:hypothetical protein